MPPKITLLNRSRNNVKGNRKEKKEKRRRRRDTHKIVERTSVEFFAAGREIIGKVARSNAIVKRWRIGGHADNNRWLASIETRWAGFMGKSGDTWRAASDRQSASQLRDRDRWSRRAGRRGGKGETAEEIRGGKDDNSVHRLPPKGEKKT